MFLTFFCLPVYKVMQRLCSVLESVISMDTASTETSGVQENVCFLCKIRLC